MKVQQKIEHLLQQSLSPEHLLVINESDQHNVPPGSESHFKLLVVSQEFQGMRAVPRQQKVYQILAELVAGPIHALTMQTLTPEEWEKDSELAVSPPCLGGSKVERNS